VLGRGRVLSAGAKIIGNRPVGDRVSIGVDSLVYQSRISSDSVVRRDHRGVIDILPSKKPLCMAQNYFNVPV
jgi:serine O-acetyltransferase